MIFDEMVLTSMLSTRNGIDMVLTSMFSTQELQMVPDFLESILAKLLNHI